MPKDTQTPTATRTWKLALTAALVAVGLVCLALYLRPARRAPLAPPVDEPTVTDVGPTTRSYPSNEAPAVAAADPASQPATADVAVAAADAAGPALCGGKVCKEDQFCCGPPKCGYCANKLTGPECPTKCP